MQITRTIKGHTFSVQLRAVERAGVLANGAPAYTAHTTICRDGVHLGSARWDGEGFQLAPMPLADPDDSADVYDELAVAVREHLAALPDGILEGSTVRTMPASPGHRLDRWGRSAGTTGVALTAAWRSIGGDVVSVRLEDGSVLPYPVAELELELEPAPAETPVRAALHAPMQRVTFALELHRRNLRMMAVGARTLASGVVGPMSIAWDALADALDAAAERDEAGNAPEAP